MLKTLSSNLCFPGALAAHLDWMATARRLQAINRLREHASAIHRHHLSHLTSLPLLQLPNFRSLCISLPCARRSFLDSRLGAA